MLDTANSDITTVTVTILDNKYKINCKPEEVSALQQSAIHVDQKMRAIKVQSNVTKVDRLAVTVALNLVHDNIVQSEQKEQEITEYKEVIKTLSSKLDQAISRLSNP